MTEEEFRTAIQLSEDHINMQFERDKRKLLCKLQARNSTYIKNPGLITYTLAYEDLVNEAKDRMALEADAIEKQFYDELPVV